MKQEKPMCWCCVWRDITGPDNGIASCKRRSRSSTVTASFRLAAWYTSRQAASRISAPGAATQVLRLIPSSCLSRMLLSFGISYHGLPPPARVPLVPKKKV